VLMVMLDVAWPTLTTQGSGPLTQRVTNGAEFVAVKAYSMFGRRGVLVSSGPLAIVVTGSLWLLSLWCGWFLIFSAFPEYVVEAQTNSPANVVERIYFVGFTLSTLGVGDFKPDSGLYQILTALAAFNGLVLVTLVITYAVPLVQGVVLRRKLAFSISLLGQSPQDIAWTAWQARKSKAFENALEQIATGLIQCSEQRLAYPMLDLFFCKRPRFSLGVQLGRLDEALSILTVGLQPNYRRSSLTVQSVREVISHYLHRVDKKSSETSVLVAPPLPAVGLLDIMHVPILEAQGAAFKHLDMHRVRLHKLVHREGWEWSVVGDENLAGEFA